MIAWCSMIGLACFLAALQRIGMLALCGLALPAGSGAPLAACVGTSLFMIAASALAPAVPLPTLLPLALAVALAAAALAHRVCRDPEPGPALPVSAAGSGAGSGIVVDSLLIGLFGMIALRGYFYDELDHHLPLAFEILRGLYPPPYPFLPAASFRYYLGVDLLAACVTSVSGLSPWYAFDVLTMLCLWAMLRLIRVLAASAPVAGAGALAAPLAVLGGGLAWVRFVTDAWRLRPDLPTLFALPFSRLEYEPWQLPPVAGYVFQHPMALGLPLFLACLVLWLHGPRRLAPLAVLGGTVLGALGLSQTVLFYLAVAALACGVVVRAALAGRASASETARWLAFTVAGLTLYVLGSGPTRAVAPGGGLLALRWPPHLGWGDDWPFPGYLEAFGIPAALAVPGIWLALRWRWEAGLLLSAIAIGTFAGPHVVEFRQSPWNTTKLFVPFMLCSSVLAATLLAHVTAAMTRPWRRRYLFACLLPACASPLLFLWVRALGPLDVDPAHRPIPRVLLPPPEGGLDRVAGEWLSLHAGRDDVALALGLHVTAFSGVPSFAPPGGTSAWAHSLDPDGRYRRDLALLWRKLPSELVARYRIRWIVVGPAERALLGPEAVRSLADPTRARLRATIGSGAQARRIHEVVAPGAR
ncbi:MAG: hypothetical protein HY815_21110 [Candidatus Riflebacteria bacterium]|nr:hypothetical protein [Candidatus Riflebacteria bacterium]